MSSDLSRNEVKEEGNLLIEAVSLLVQRQRETESWVSEQMWQADERAAATDRRYAELEARLESIEVHLARLVHAIEPPQDAVVVDERLTRLREQVEDLKADAGGHLARSLPTAVDEPAPEPDAVPTVGESAPLQHTERPPLARPMVAQAGPNATLWDLLGASPQDRVGLLLIGAGAIAVLYAILTQLRL